ncbi:MAG: DUF1385 domain-containing protein [Acidobacteriota bacterium]
MSLSKFIRLQAHLQLMPLLESGEEPTLVGGQAVLEGVMMRAPHSYAITVRKSNGELVTDQQAIPRMSEKYPLFKYPVLRGLGTLGQAMQLGFKAMNFSMNTLLEETEPGAAKAKPTPAWLNIFNIAFPVLFFIFMYKFVPLYLAEQIGTSRFSINIWDGVIRLAIFLAFMFGISLVKDIRRVFEYHGAEHKVVFNFESGKPVTVENAQSFVTFHPRCGTSFMLVMMVIAMIIYAFLPFDGFLLKLASRIVLLPLIIGLSYELIRFAARRQGTLMGLLTAPGLWLQRITTKQPDDAQAEVAIHALQHAMALEEKQGGELVIA